MILTEGILRARYRHSFTHAELLGPDAVFELRLDLWATTNVFLPGHSIRLDISSSNFPRFDANPNTGEPLGLNRRVVAAENTIYHDAPRPSHIVLPLAPARP